MFDSDEDVMVSQVNTKITACVDHGCYACEKYYANASSLRNHMQLFHAIELPPRKTGTRRPRNVKYEWKTKKQFHRRTLMGCPSCWFYCPLNFRRIAQHIKEFHLDPDNEGIEDPSIDEDEANFDDENMVQNQNPLDITAAKADIFAAIEALTGKFNSLFK